uniref:Uncharacterized protein n=1 Tax=Buteo japonicus TaxID=224669 RepID=A0A8B9YYK4_9AVES
EAPPGCCSGRWSCRLRCWSCWRCRPRCWSCRPSCWSCRLGCWSCWRCRPRCWSCRPSCWSCRLGCWSCWRCRPRCWSCRPSCWSCRLGCWSCWRCRPRCWSCWSCRPRCWSCRHMPHTQCLAVLYSPSCRLPALPAVRVPSSCLPVPGRPGDLGPAGRDALGLEGSAPQPFCPSPAKPCSVALRVWGFFAMLP